MELIQNIGGCVFATVLIYLIKYCYFLLGGE